MNAISMDIVVRYSETGGLGFVSHSSFYDWYDMIQYEFLRKHGFEYAQMEQQGHMLVTIENSCKFLAPAYLGQELRISMSVKEITPLKAVFEYDIIRKQDGVRIAKGHSVHACVDRNFRPVVFETQLPGLHRLLKQLAE